MTTQTARIVVKADTKEIKGLNDELDELSSKSVKADKNTEALSKATKKANSNWKIQKNAVQQASFQIQDFAVQVGGGTSAVQAFNQQAPQFFSIFGAGGAVLGGALAIAGAIGGPLLISLFDSKEAVELLDVAMENLNTVIRETSDGALELDKSLVKISETSRLAAGAQLKQGDS